MKNVGNNLNIITSYVADWPVSRKLWKNNQKTQKRKLFDNWLWKIWQTLNYRIKREQKLAKIMQENCVLMIVSEFG